VLLQDAGTDLPLLAQGAVALGLGLFIGLEREHRHVDEKDRDEAILGVRTFALFGLTGWLAALLAEQAVWMAGLLLGLILPPGLPLWMGVLGSLIATLQRNEAAVDSALIYVSDHGESLGERNLYLHGLPWFIAPKEQKQVPMVMWLSRGFARAAAIDPACLRRRAAEPASHDHLFHTVLGLLDVKTAVYEPAWDLADGCRSAP